MNVTFQLSDTEIATLCVMGGYAPSGGNMQPWHVDIREKRILEICINKNRAGTFLDVMYSASYIALGCFLENVCLTADKLLLQFSKELFVVDNTVGIRITFSGRSQHAFENAKSLFEYIPMRHTNRNIWNGKKISTSLIESLTKIPASASDIVVHFFDQHIQKKEIAHILGKADGIRYTHPKLFQEMMNEFRWSETETATTNDGIDLDTLELPGNMKMLFKLLRQNTFLLDYLPIEIFEQTAEPLLVGCSHIGLIVSNAEVNPHLLIDTGQILERIWLTATKYNIAVQPWSIFPFFLLRAEWYNGEGFSEEENKKIIEAKKELVSFLDLPQNVVPLFIFRISFADPVSQRSFRIPWKEYVSFAP